MRWRAGVPCVCAFGGLVLWFLLRHACLTIASLCNTSSIPVHYTYLQVQGFCAVRCANPPIPSRIGLRTPAPYPETYGPVPMCSWFASLSQASAIIPAGDASTDTITPVATCGAARPIYSSNLSNYSCKEEEGQRNCSRATTISIVAGLLLGRVVGGHRVHRIKCTRDCLEHTTSNGKSS